MPTIITRGGMSGKGFGLTAGGPALASYTFTTSTSNASLNISTITGYVAGKTIVTVTVNSGVYLWASSTGNYGLTLTGGTTGDTLTLVNNGYIIGCGGLGGSSSCLFNGTNGGPALSLGFNTSITNNSYIAGGGGGGGAGGSGGGGGGGAGGGNGNRCGYYPYTSPGSGGSIGSTGSSGGGHNACGYCAGSGGGGGRQLPGSGGGAGGRGGGGGGGSGGGGGGWYCPCYNHTCSGGSGGSSNGSGGNSGSYHRGGAGGGGWGASGGSTATSGGSGGAAISKNGYTLTYITTGNVWGSVS